MRKIAIINMSPDFIDTVRGVLEEAHYEVCSEYVSTFRDGDHSFVSFVREQRPDLVVWDVSMPYASNWTFLEGLLNRAELRCTRFILLTTNSHAVERMIGRHGDFDILGKPFKIETLLASIARAFASVPREHPQRPAFDERV